MKINDRILAAFATTAIGAAAVFAIGANTGLLFGRTVEPPAALESSDVPPPEPVVIQPQTAEAPPQSPRLAGVPLETTTTTVSDASQSPVYQTVLDPWVPAADPTVDSPQVDSPEEDSPEVDSPSSNDEPESWSEEDDSYVDEQDETESWSEEEDDSSEHEEDDQTQVEDQQEESDDSKQETSDSSHEKREKDEDHGETEHDEDGDD